MCKKYVELNTFVKINNLATSGGEAKNLIRSGKIKYNGEVETRNKKKLFLGDIIEYNNKKYEVKNDVLKMKLSKE